MTAKFMGISHDLPPALKPGADVSRGASFAVDSATILGTPKDSLNLNQQVRKFDQMMSNWKDDYIPKSLFMISIGMEDYLNFTKNNPTADGSAQEAFVTSVTSRLKYNIEMLYSLGASKFVVYTLPPLGCLPIVRQEFNTGNDCYEKFNDLAKLHNAKIGPMLNDLATAKSGFQFTVFDFYNVVLRRTQRNMNFRYSFTNVSCCGTGTHNAYGCGLPNVHSKLCEYQRSYLYFDGRHHSEKAQESFAHLLFGADPNVIQPMNIRELITYPANTNMSEFWKEPVETNLLLVQDNVVDASASM
ncbi:GDSL esterase/lipase 22 [Hirschfeldia incana]|nr:GDSL esterase/lipase 22 [Hirschfeldia incana]